MISRSLFTVLLFALATELFAAVGLEISPRPMAVDQSARLSFVVSGGSASEPDFAALENDFEILSRNRQSSLKWLNGRREQTTTWVLNVMPRKAGEVRIPSFDFGAGRSPDARRAGRHAA